ncbi:hypothetical protein [Sphingomonas sp. DBB INV C78]|uniref:hypothetical protein n=1 Tax=Sphingomonas sp. DBB INV C78 TaxID=3349434 RepID=UPI0036D235AB
MKKLALTVVLILIASCNKSVPIQPNCAVPPRGFLNWNDTHFWDGRGIPITLPAFNTIKVERSGSLTWNGADIESLYGGEPALMTFLDAVAKMHPQPFTTLDFEAGAPCASIERVRALMNKHLKCEESETCLQGRAPYRSADKIAP